ncbi:helix-turn-helix domain-containing protein [Streptomyces albipurpureus]|uniref:Helix-turn-helix domain-containing protein n=1 Tax=Streptomyces albipurpureus TaxID=2897419 RepID=A0ABT0UTU8_9ACTN|nr:helix-turn-helix transcriptional regulator [Streptomyces sp. CWNU-1]MCM2391671.1 helix-turn-helix domain-containing protein [Streptomyces sp. CWNU-1]
MHQGPVVRRRQLGEELRKVRLAAGLTSRRAGELADWHQSKVSRIETGTSGVKPEDVRLLLDLYGVSEPPLRTLLETLAGAADGGSGGWWHAYRSVLPPEYRDFISLESQASSVRSMETSVVPGLLQTARYARAITRATLEELPAATVDQLVEVRMTRQAVLRAADPLRLSVVLDEAALRREIGGTKVMKEQLRSLAESAALPQVKLQIMPFSAGEYVGLAGSFVIFSFSTTSDLDVVVLDHLASSLHVERAEDLAVYGTAFATMQARALSPVESLDLITGIAAGA